MQSRKPYLDVRRELVQGTRALQKYPMGVGGTCVRKLLIKL